MAKYFAYRIFSNRSADVIWISLFLNQKDQCLYLSLIKVIGTKNYEYDFKTIQAELVMEDLFSSFL